MIKRIVTLCSLLLSLSSLASDNLMPIDKLLTEPKASMAQFSPNAQMISLAIFDNNQRFFSIINLATNTEMQVSALNNMRIASYQWLDNKSLHVTTSGRSEYFVELSFEGDKVSAKKQKINYPGYVVHVFANTQNVLFAKLRPFESGGFELFLTDKDSLIFKTLDLKKQLGGPRRHVSYFSYDVEEQRIIATMVDTDQKSISLEYRRLNELRWHELFTLVDADYTFLPIGFLNDSTLAVLTNQKTDKVSFFEFDIASKTLGKTIYEHPKFDLVDASLKKINASNRPYSVSYRDHGKYSTHFLDAEARKESMRVNTTLKGLQWYVETQNEAQDKLIIRTLSSSNPGAYFLYDKSADTITKLYDMYPDLQGYEFAKTQVYALAGKDNLDIETYLTKAVQNRLNVLLVSPHGGPIGVREDSDFDPVTQFYANRGFDILQVNFRGSQGFGKRFLESGIGEFGQAIEEDISTALNDLLSKHNYDQICAMGSSYGGYSSMMLALSSPSQFQCVVASYGVYDLPLLYSASNFSYHFGKEATDSILGENNQRLFENSPLYNLDKLTANVKVIAGTHDQIAHVEQSERLVYLLEKLGKPFDSLFYQGVGHGHSSWPGEVHEAAISFDFILDSLNLTDLATLYPGTHNQKQLGHQYRVIGNAYLFKDSVINDFEKSVAYFNKAVELGDPNATFNLGWMHNNGKHFEKDRTTAIEYFNRAADLGHAHANYNLGDYYEFGIGVEKNVEIAFNYYMKAAELNYGDAATRKVAEMLCLGNGVKKNFRDCMHRINSIVTGSPLSNDNYDSLFSIMLDERLEDSEKSELQELIGIQVAPNGANSKIIIEQVGLFGKDYARTLIHDAIDVDGNETGYIGVKFELTKQSGNDKKQPYIYYRWVQHFQNGSNKVQHTASITGFKKNTRILYTMNDEPKIDSKWTLEIYNESASLLFSKSFNVTF